jgi:hypothetical protein
MLTLRQSDAFSKPNWGNRWTHEHQKAEPRAKHCRPLAPANKTGCWERISPPNPPPSRPVAPELEQLANQVLNRRFYCTQRRQCKVNSPVAAPTVKAGTTGSTNTCWNDPGFVHGIAMVREDSRALKSHSMSMERRQKAAKPSVLSGLEWATRRT